MSGRALIALSDRTATTVHRAGLAVGWLTVVALGFGALAGVIPANPEGGTLSIVEAPLQIGLLLVVAAGLLLAIRWPAPGATAVVLGGLGLAVLSAIEYAPWVAVVVAASCATSGFLLWLGWQRAESLTAVVVLATVTSLVLAAAWVGGSAVYDRFFGPTHPTSPTPALDDPDIEWAWSGAVTDDGARIVVKPREGPDRIGVLIAGPDGATVELGPVDVVDGLASLQVTGLRPSTDYVYRFRLPDGGLSGWLGHVRTFPGPGDERVLRLAFSSCARTGSSGMVYDAIRAADADLFVITGDLHYQNIATDDPDAFATAYDRVLTAPAQAALYRSTPIAYVWDDHDFGGNDADGSSASWPAARASYEQTVPSYDLVDDRTINQALS
ncbi:MAG: hypothetical protein MUE78_10180, partial [Ilumatobacteraceae bacterium]|nr:hypothetical protein [Ilumatobacteraceae bacterium]